MFFIHVTTYYNRERVGSLTSTSPDVDGHKRCRALRTAVLVRVIIKVLSRAKEQKDTNSGDLASVKTNPCRAQTLVGREEEFDLFFSFFLAR